MRTIRHHCKDLTCPLNAAMVMVFAPAVEGAIDSCRRLWDTSGKMIALQKFTVRAWTLHLDDEEIEQGLLDGVPEAWADFRMFVGEHDFPVLLPNIDALVVSPDSPGEIWEAEGRTLWLPKDATVQRGRGEHASWRDAGLESAEDVLRGLLPELEEGPADGEEEPDEGDDFRFEGL